METFHLYHLAKCWGAQHSEPSSPAVPLAAGPVNPIVLQNDAAGEAAVARPLAAKDTSIKAAAVHLVYASRTSQGFITPDEVTALEEWTGLVRPTFQSDRSSPSHRNVH